MGGRPKSGDMCTQTADSVCEQYEKVKDRTLKDELPRSVGAQWATGDQ